MDSISGSECSGLSPQVTDLLVTVTETDLTDLLVTVTETDLTVRSNVLAVVVVDVSLCDVNLTLSSRCSCCDLETQKLDLHQEWLQDQDEKKNQEQSDMMAQ